MTEVKKSNWRSRKTTFQKVLFIIAAIIFVGALVLLFLVMDGRRVFGDDFANRLFGEGVPNGYVHLWNNMINSSISWLVTAIVIVVSFVLIFLGNFITHLFDNKSRKAKI